MGAAGAAGTAGAAGVEGAAGAGDAVCRDAEPCRSVAGRSVLPGCPPLPRSPLAQALATLANSHRNLNPMPNPNPNPNSNPNANSNALP